MRTIFALVVSISIGQATAQENSIQLAFSNAPLSAVLHSYAALTDCKVERVSGVDAELSFRAEQYLSPQAAAALIESELQKQNIGLYTIATQRLVAAWVDPGLAPTNDVRRLSYSERLRRRRQAEETRMQELAKRPQATPEKLHSQLEQYQMDVIRKGEPPLPIPLTKEMHDQLIKEGHLPPNGPDPAGVIYTNSPASGPDAD